MVTENGAAFRDILEDGQVMMSSGSHMLSHIFATLEARRRGVPVEGYFVWSLLDNFEGQRLRPVRYHHVDYDSLSAHQRPVHSG